MEAFLYIVLGTFSQTIGRFGRKVTKVFKPTRASEKVRKHRTPKRDKRGWRRKVNKRWKKHCERMKRNVTPRYVSEMSEKAKSTRAELSTDNSEGSETIGHNLKSRLSYFKLWLNYFYQPFSVDHWPAHQVRRHKRRRKRRRFKKKCGWRLTIQRKKSKKKRMVLKDKSRSNGKDAEKEDTVVKELQNPLAIPRPPRLPLLPISFLNNQPIATSKRAERKPTVLHRYQIRPTKRELLTMKASKRCHKGSKCRHGARIDGDLQSVCIQHFDHSTESQHEQCLFAQPFKDTDYRLCQAHFCSGGQERQLVALKGKKDDTLSPDWQPACKYHSYFCKGRASKKH